MPRPTIRAALAAALFPFASAGAAPAQEPAAPAAPRIVNIVNFVRQCEPRIEWITEDVLFETVERQVAAMQRHALRGTFLLQYDALVDPRYQRLMKDLPEDAFEIGAWWEIPQPLVEDSGMRWRGRHRWDWHADVGFATGYTPAERERLVDTYMARFHEVFGRHPASVGSWFLDAHTLRYLHERYGVIASCNCKDQIGTDGYTLWGGYWNQGYYPSRNNAYMPAQSCENQIPVPVFRMLGSDPIHQYDSGLGTERQRVVSLEPIYDPGGANPDWCRWYFAEFVAGEPLAYAYTQVGQENSFTWRRMGRGFEMQMALVARLRDEGKLRVETLGETGAWFRARFEVTPPTAVTVLSDHLDTDQKTVWFDSRFYRANLLWDRDALRVRDVHVFDERLASDYLTARGTSTHCLFETLPVVDGWRWSTADEVAGLRVRTADGRDVRGGAPSVTCEEPGTLTVRWPTQEPAGTLTLRFTEASLVVTAGGELAGSWLFELTTAERAALPFVDVEPTRLRCRHRGTDYTVEAARGRFVRAAGRALCVVPDEGTVQLGFARR